MGVSREQKNKTRHLWASHLFDGDDRGVLPKVAVRHGGMSLVHDIENAARNVQASVGAMLRFRLESHRLR